MFINKKWHKSAVNCEAYSSFEGVSPDHRNVTTKYDWAYERMHPEQQPLYTKTGPCWITGILEINLR